LTIARIARNWNVIRPSPSRRASVKKAHRLAQAIANETGESITRAVTEALRERYERLHKRDPAALAADIRAIAGRASAHIKQPYLDHADFLYDEHGLPK
jgi:antitoxin VapB